MWLVLNWTPITPRSCKCIQPPDAPSFLRFWKEQPTSALCSAWSPDLPWCSAGQPFLIGNSLLCWQRGSGFRINPLSFFSSFFPSFSSSLLQLLLYPTFHQLFIFISRSFSRHFFIPQFLPNCEYPSNWCFGFLPLRIWRGTRSLNILADSYPLSG